MNYFTLFSNHVNLATEFDVGKNQFLFCRFGRQISNLNRGIVVVRLTEEQPLESVQVHRGVLANMVKVRLVLPSPPVTLGRT